MNYYEPTITVLPDRVEVEAPYNQAFIEGASSLAGVFDTGKWTFSLRDQIDVRKLAESVYGFDGLTTPPKIDVQVIFNTEMVSEPYKSIDIMSRPVARATDKPGVLKGHGIIHQSGSLKKSGKRVIIGEGAELTFRDVPYSLYEREVAAAVDEYSLTQIQPELMVLEQMFFEHDQLCKRYQELQTIFEYSNVDPSFVKSVIEQGRAV